MKPKSETLPIFNFFYTDPECRYVPSENPIIEGDLNEEVVIPCKPTSKRSEVELIKEDDKVNVKTCHFLLKPNQN